MTATEIKDELESYGIPTSGFVEKDELVQALRSERAKRGSLASPKPRKRSSKSPARIRKSKSSELVSPPYSKARLTKSKSFDSDYPLASPTSTKTDKQAPPTKYEENQIVFYTNNNGVQEKARILFFAT